MKEVEDKEFVWNQGDRNQSESTHRLPQGQGAHVQPAPTCDRSPWPCSPTAQPLRGPVLRMPLEQHIGDVTNHSRR